MADLSNGDGSTSRDDFSQKPAIEFSIATAGGTTLLSQPTKATGIVFLNVGSGLGAPPLDSTWRMVNWVYATDQKAMVKTAASTTWNAGTKTGFSPLFP